jgi:hypothetical protein
MVSVQPLSLGKSRQSATFRPISVPFLSVATIFRWLCALDGAHALHLFDNADVEVSKHHGPVAKFCKAFGEFGCLGEG